MIKIAWLKADKIGFYSNAHRKAIQKDFNLSDRKALTLYYGINIKNKKPLPLDLDSYIFSIGISYRDYGTLMAVAKKYPKNFIVVSQQFALDGLHIPPNVKVFTNTFGKPAKELMKKAAIIILPLAFDNSPAAEATLLEAMWYGKPTIVTRTITTEEYVEDKVSGLLVPIKDVDSIIDALDYIYENPERAKKIGKTAQQTVRNRFTHEILASNISKVIYDDLFNNNHVSKQN